MSEDKMRDIWAAADSAIETAYPNIYNLNKGMWGHQQIPNHGILRGAIAKAIVDERDACAAIKDAEIAARDLMIKELQEALIKISTFPRYEMPGDIAREALAKSEHIEALTPVVTTDETGRAVCVSMQNEEGQMKRIIWEVDSEHHNSRALEKMLLEARIEELEDLEPVSSINICRVVSILEAKLAELNKE